MSFAQIQSAARLSQQTLAEHAGMTPGAAGNGMLNGFPVTGVYGSPIVQEIMMPGGGYRRRVAMTYTMMREQVERAPLSKTTFVRTDLVPPIPYVIDTVDTHQPINYVLVLVKAGE